MIKLLFYLCAFYCWFSCVLALCPKGTVESVANPTLCYLFNSTKLAHLNAEETCIQNNGHLVSIHNMLENVFITEQSQLYFTDSASSDFWIGTTDLMTHGTWVWTDKSLLDFVDWDKGQPQIEWDCASSKLQDGTWISDNCYKEKPFVCLVKPVETTPATPKCPENWNFFDETNSCYIILRNATWDIAEDTCFSHNAHLASIHSSDENHFITNLIPFDPNDYECNEGQYARIGLFRVSNISNWRWTDNTPYDYADWAPYHPVSTYTTTIIWNGPLCKAPSETWANSSPEIFYQFFVCKKPAL